MTWEPKVGMKIKRKCDGLRVEIVERRLIGDRIFWLIQEDRHSTVDETPWLIPEDYLLESYGSDT